MNKHVVTINETDIRKNIEHKGCGECQTSCQSACKTSCTVGNQVCINKEDK
ncbi:MAG: six-cysteine ranthipeptide SCIFF [Negativicutes bacterium]|jgi:predicted ribosomally synthesized six-cysteine peptide SCIFF